jgi:hypothetical protein
MSETPEELCLRLVEEGCNREAIRAALATHSNEPGFKCTPVVNTAIMQDNVLFLRAAIIIFEINKNWSCILSFAVEHGKTESIEYLLARGFACGADYCSQALVVRDAISTGNLTLAERLLSEYQFKWIWNAHQTPSISVLLDQYAHQRYDSTQYMRQYPISGGIRICIDRICLDRLPELSDT